MLCQSNGYFRQLCIVVHMGVCTRKAKHKFLSKSTCLFSEWETCLWESELGSSESPLLSVPPFLNAGLGGHGWKQLRVLRGGCLAFLGYEGLSVFRVTWLTAPLQLQLALYNLLASAFRLCANFTNISTMETAAIKCLFPDSKGLEWNPRK